MHVDIPTLSDLYEVNTKNSLEEVLSSEEKMFLIGSGSNTVFLNSQRVNLLKIDNNEMVAGEDCVKVGSGIIWDDFIVEYIKMGGVGMESLSAIPGTVGASPVQNIGAYGKEVSEFIKEVECFDLQEKKWTVLSNKECQFSYRDSLFKKHKDRYIIWSVTFNILKGGVKIPDYQDVQKFFQEHPFMDIHIANIRKAIIIIRSGKFPEQSSLPNCGSFFKNVVVGEEVLENLRSKFSSVPVFKLDTVPATFKIPTAFLIEQLGLKGDYSRKFGMYKHHALILVNADNGNRQDFLNFLKFVQDEFEREFGITLEAEVNIV